MWLREPQRTMRAMMAAMAGGITDFVVWILLADADDDVKRVVAGVKHDDVSAEQNVAED